MARRGRDEKLYLLSIFSMQPSRDEKVTALQRFPPTVHVLQIRYLMHAGL